jgi:hypothetical protein
MSNGNAPVAVFNTNANGIQVSVNTGAPLTINGTGPSQNWNPQQPSSNPLSYSNGYPAPNVLGSMGVNQVMVMVNGAPISQPLQISIPQYAPVFSLQLYIFFSAYSTVSWTLLSSGQPFSSGTALSNNSMMMAVPKKAPSKSRPGKSKSSKSKSKSKKS